MQSSLYKFLFTLFLNVLNLFSPMIYGVSVGILLCNWKLGSRIYFFYQISFDLVLMRKRMIIISSFRNLLFCSPLSSGRWPPAPLPFPRWLWKSAWDHKMRILSVWREARLIEGGLQTKKCLLEDNGLCVLNNFGWMTERPSVNCTWSVRQIKNTHELSANRSRGH